MKVGEFCSRRLLILTSALVLLMGTMAVVSNAQATRTPNNAARRVEDFNNQSVRAERDDMNKELRGKRPSAEELKRSAAVKAQLKEDLESLQDEYNALVSKLKASETMTPKLAVEVGERVHFRSERLLKNLNLPAPNPTEPVEPKSYTEDTNRLFRSLCSLLFQFITNPMFESPSPIDAESATTARVTLEELIRLSDHIRHRS